MSLADFSHQPLNVGVFIYDVLVVVPNQTTGNKDLYLKFHMRTLLNYVEGGRESGREDGHPSV